MDEYEVDLMDYLEVMWKGKWIILACLVVAVAVSVAVMWTRPNEYSGTIHYQLYESLSSFSISSLDRQEVVNTFSDFKAEYQDKGVVLKAGVENNRIKVSLAGPVSSDAIVSMFQTLASSVDSRLQQYAGKQIEQESLDTKLSIDQLTAQRDALKADIEAIDSPEPENPLLNYLTQNVSQLEARLVEEQVKLETLDSIAPGTLFTVEELGDPVVSLIGPNRKMSVAVAGVLGLFVGVLLAFFIHYVKGARKQKQ